MKIYRAKLMGVSRNKGIVFYHFGYQSKFVEGIGVITLSDFEANPRVHDMEVSKFYNVYYSVNGKYNNITKVYPVDVH